MSLSYDLFSERPQKCHPHALRLKELIERYLRQFLVFGLSFSFHVLRPFCSLLGLLAACLL
jgi:hypothetical protein